MLEPNAHFYELGAKTTSGEEIKMASYRNKVVLIVNTATKCGFAPQFKELEELHQKYKDDGLVILGFPCNQFLNQEPETNSTMESSCLRNFGVTFQLFEKCNVNGPDTHPVFSYLKSNLNGFLSPRIKWNFTKFLIDKNGVPIKRFSSFVKPKSMEQYIKKLLSEKK